MGRRAWDEALGVQRVRRESQGAGESLASSRASRKLAAHLHAAQPLADRQEGLLGREVIHNNHTVGLSEELLTDTAISATGEPLSEVCLPWEPQPSLGPADAAPHLSWPAVSHSWRATCALSTVTVFTR